MKFPFFMDFEKMDLNLQFGLVWFTGFFSLIKQNEYQIQIQLLYARKDNKL